MQNPILPIEHLRDLLKQEYEFEKSEYRIQTEKMSVGRKVKRGICWYPIRCGRSYYNSLNQLVVIIEQEEPQDIDHNFEHGRPVIFFSQQDKKDEDNTINQLSRVNQSNSNIKYIQQPCQISYVEANKMVVVLPSTHILLEIQNTEHLGIQLYFDETSYRTMFHALDDVLKAKDNRLAELRNIIAG